MTYTKETEAILLLEDGTLFVGKAVGKIGTTTGEICFNTGMTGYQEIYTDPSYYGQIVVNTNAHIGNYGTLSEDNESSNVMVRGMVCNFFSPIYSRNIADESLQQYLERQNVVCISNIDTRLLVKHIRDEGAMNAIISSDQSDMIVLKKRLKETPSMKGLELSSLVSTKETYTLGDPKASVRIAILDLGVKKNILNNFTDRGAFVKVFPAKTSFKEILAFEPNGFFISNGPGDPSVMDYAINTVKEALEAKMPIFGICLGHQILAQASGLKTYKMHQGHRGLNQPVKNLITGKSEITSQNHGFAVDKDNLDSIHNVEMTHVNLNDHTVAGIRLTDHKAFSVQYHPESSPGPNDSTYLFDDFFTLLK